MILNSGHVPKYTRLSLRISDVGSKVITKIVRAEEGEPGDEAICTHKQIFTWSVLHCGHCVPFILHSIVF